MQMIATWQEALVAIMAHEAYHLRQHTTKAARNHGKYSEVDTEWAAHDALQEWREEQGYELRIELADSEPDVGVLDP